MTQVIHKTPCKVCPFRKDSLKGYLGEYENVDEFFKLWSSEFHMPCHTDPNYNENCDNQDFSNNSHCAGSLILYKNSCSLPRTKELSDKVVQVDKNDLVFQFEFFFKQHHTVEK